MKLSDFDYTLPERFIAKVPLAERSKSRLLVLDRQQQSVSHQQFSQLIDFIEPGDALILNNSKVIPARLFGVKPSGGRVEVLAERIQSPKHCLAHIRASKPPKPETVLLMEGNILLKVLGRQEDLYELELLDSPLSFLEMLQQYGHMPLPPYLQREDDLLDKERYQTVYAKTLGSVAAPTAGLHFDEGLLQAIKAKGAIIDYVTLHVGAGTFQPVRTEDITQHVMHYEYLTVPSSIVELIQQTKQRGKKVIAVGTTSVRSLETAAQSGTLQPFTGESNLFIYPGYEFKVVDAMVTNFHLPKTSLLMLVSAFAGLEAIQQAYTAAIAEQYRFFSYGDAMLIA
jgi:S-adenosylmethionine:tRNA ribosyltransferase-isomerase